MKRLVTSFALILLMSTCILAQESGEVIITEIMYNAASSESTTETQFIEIANTTSSPISLLNWTIDDEDTDGPNTLPDVTIPGYGIVVICGSNASDFQGAWGTGFSIISLDDLGQTMFNLSNSPSGSSEIIQLRDASSNLIDEVNFDDTSPWPVDNGQSSIYLSIAKDQMSASTNNSGGNWANSANGVDGAFESTPTGVWNATDVGSPGNIHGDASLPVELSSFTAAAGDGQVTLRWVTASEVDNQGFAILRSEKESADYSKIDSYISNSDLKGAGNSSHTINYQYIDKSVVNDQTYWYKLVDVDVNGIRTEHGPIQATPKAENTDDPAAVPQAFNLKNFPNPFNPGTTISFDLSSFSGDLVNVKLDVYDLLGKKITTLVNGKLEKKFYEFHWNGIDDNGHNAPTGVYIYSFQSPQMRQSKKMILMR